MSWSRDFFEEVRKIDESVSSYISTLGFSASEQMLIGSIILFGTVTNLEAIRSFKRLLNFGGRLTEDERFRLFFRLVDPPKTSGIPEVIYEEKVKGLLRFMTTKFNPGSSPKKRVLAVRLIISNLQSEARKIKF